MRRRRLPARVPNPLRWRRQPDRSGPRHVRASDHCAGFVTADYSGPMGVTDIRIHDFLSSEASEGLQLSFDLARPAKILVPQIR